MNKDVKNRWLALMESGEYKMGFNRLYTPSKDEHCPLGVLVELAIDEGVFEPVLKYNSFGKKSLEGVRPSSLSQDIREWAELEVSELWNIASMNDSSGTQVALEFIRSL